MEILDLISHGELDSLSSLAEGLRRGGSQIVATNGCFDILHAGHAALFSDIAKAACCDNPAIIVLLNSDSSIRALKGEDRPIFNELDRAMLVASIKNVCHVHIFDGERCGQELFAIRPHIYVKGGDYTLDKLDPSERISLERCGAKIKFVPYRMGRSTTAVIERLGL